MVLKGGKLKTKCTGFDVLAIIVVITMSIFTACTNALYEEAEAIQLEATAQTRIPVMPKSPTVSPVDGPAGDGVVLVSWDAVPGTTAYDVYYSSTVSPPSMPNGGTNISGTSCTISGLSNWNNYYFWIIAKNRLGASPLSIPPATGSSGIKVTSITLNKSAATFLVGSQEAFAATCMPSNATFPDVTWTTSNASFATVSNGIVTGGTTAGTATITATVADGLSATLAATNKIFAVNTAGPAGWILFYDKGSYSDGWRYMEAASVNGSGYLYWRNGSNIDIPGAYGTEFGTGRANTDAIITAQGAGTYMASDCRAYTQGGYHDWFMPSQIEANQMLYIVTSINYTSLWGFASSSQMAINGCWTFRQATVSPYAWGWNATLTSFGGYATYVTRPIRQF